MSSFLHASSKFGVVNPLYQTVVRSFPEGIQMALAYGSGVFRQEGQKSTHQNMMDFIFVVDHPVNWHKENLQINGSHYSFLKNFGPKVVSNIQSFSAGMYFNTIVPFEDRFIKYGVISTDSFKQDLIHWDHLYVSGRLQKPVMTVTIPDNVTVQLALDTNLRSAVHTSLLLLPQKFSELDFFMKIAELSYAGDVRMGIGEDRNKVKNIVSAGLSNFKILYKSLLHDTDHIYWDEHNECLEQESNYTSRSYHLNQIPANILKHASPLPPEDMGEVKEALARDTDCDKHISKALQNIVGYSSKWQSAKGILTGGLVKSTKYGARKVKKWLESLNK